MHSVDAIVIIAYLLTLVAIGLRFSARQKTTDAYFVAGRSVPGWAAGLSLLATTITSVTFIAYPGAAYAGDWTLLGPGILFLLVIVAAGPIVVPFFRHAVSMSVYEYFGQRFGRLVRMYAACTFALGSFAKMGFVFYLLALSMASFTGWPMGLLIAGLGVISIFYTLMGGFSAVIWTDVAQGLLLWTGVAITIVILIFFSGARPAAMFHLIAASGKMSLGSPHFDLSRPTFWTLAIYGVFFYLQRYTADQSVVQRYLAAKSDRAALRGMAMGAALCLPVWTAFMLIGSLLWALYRITGQALPAAVTRADQVFPYYMVSHMPPGVSGVFLAALFGAAMSMLASDLNCVGLILVQDFYAQFLPDSTDAQRLRFGKLVIVVCGAMAIAVALGLTRTRGSALALYYAATAILAGGLAALFLLAFLCRRAGRAAALIGIAVNVIFTTYATLTLGGGKFVNLHGLNYPWSEYTIGACGNVLFLAAGLAGAALFPARADGSLRHTLWDWLASRKQLPIPVIQLGDTL
ncbi:MAG TPA: sodium/solute symporter [Terracidiphilus sp.]|jgi:SSS family solute:Na+ symporter|nr:sodium/solute symporter [Terracidiphilus sp.]